MSNHFSGPDFVFPQGREVASMAERSACRAPANGQFWVAGNPPEVDRPTGGGRVARRRINGYQSVAYA